MSHQRPSSDDGGVEHHSYPDIFRQHLQHFQNHLAGTPNAVPGSSGSHHLVASHVGPASFWSQAEKDAFFHGLSIHSRFRPDLIATDVKTKTLFEVECYLDALEDASARVKADPRNMYEPAVEVSDDWLGWEEKEAALLAANESRLDEQRRIPQASHQHQSPPQNETRLSSAKLDSHCLFVLDGLLDEEELRWASLDETITNSMDIDELEDPGRPVAHHSTPDHSQNGEVADATDSEAELSPASRRRRTKRLYMRKKRAQARQEEPILDDRILRPGRKKRVRSPSPQPTSSPRSGHTSVVDDTAPSEASHPGGEETAAINIARRFIEENGIDYQWLMDKQLDLFHLGALGRLRHDPSIAISTDTISLLACILETMIRDVVYRAIVLRETQNQAKKKTKAWRLSEQSHISSSVIVDALTLTENFRRGCPDGPTSYEFDEDVPNLPQTFLQHGNNSSVTSVDEDFTSYESMKREEID